MPKSERSEAMDRSEDETALRELRIEPRALQDRVEGHGARPIGMFERRDAAGKGGVIEAITDRVMPRVSRVVALPAPSDREKGQVYAQRYLKHAPAAGESVILDRSGVKRKKVKLPARSKQGACGAPASLAGWRFVQGKY
jgi:polyphosphate kinase 2 (PPK2 family)